MPQAPFLPKSNGHTSHESMPFITNVHMKFKGDFPSCSSSITSPYIPLLVGEYFLKKETSKFLKKRHKHSSVVRHSALIHLLEFRILISTYTAYVRNFIFCVYRHSALIYYVLLLKKRSVVVIRKHMDVLVLLHSSGLCDGKRLVHGVASWQVFFFLLRVASWQVESGFGQTKNQTQILEVLTRT